MTFVCFHFALHGKWYCWHQPQESVRFQYKTTAESRTFVLDGQEKSVALDPRKFAEAKDLLRWVIVQAANPGLKEAA